LYDVEILLDVERPAKHAALSIGGRGDRFHLLPICTEVLGELLFRKTRLAADALNELDHELLAPNGDVIIVSNPRRVCQFLFRL
jgi:hypothetical protein